MHTNILGSGTCHRDGYLFSRDWYKERYQFSQFWYKERYRFSRFFYEIKCRIYYFEKIGIRSGILFQKIGIRTSIFLKPRWHIPDQNLVECTPPPRETLSTQNLIISRNFQYWPKLLVSYEKYGYTPGSTFQTNDR